MKNREKFGKYSFYVLVFISLALYLFSSIYLKSASESDADIQEYLRNKYLISFYVFSFFLPLGCILRELYTMEHYKYLLKIKTIIAVLVLVVGTIVIFLIPTAVATQIAMYAAIISLIYILIPTKVKERDNK